MASKLQLISTDFDGTLFAEFENPPISGHFVSLIADLQKQGVKWMINTGRDMSSLMEALGRSHLPVQPDFLVLVEREIHCHNGVRYVGLADWNDQCVRDHQRVFGLLRPALPRLIRWIQERYPATIYEDPYSPFCLIASDNPNADVIHEHLNEFCHSIPDLVVMRNDIYMRLSHAAYNKGAALRELSRRLGFGAGSVLAAGDHLNDLPMLTPECARWLVVPSNAVPQVRDAVLRLGGHVSKKPCGHGVAEGIELALRKQQ